MDDNNGVYIYINIHALYKCIHIYIYIYTCTYIYVCIEHLYIYRRAGTEPPTTAASLSDGGDRPDGLRRPGRSPGGPKPCWRASWAVAVAKIGSIANVTMVYIMTYITIYYYICVFYVV